MRSDRVISDKPILAALLGLLLSLSFSALAETYSYDELGRLTKVVYDDNTSITYRYDSMGNRTQARVGKETPASNAPEGGSSGGGCFIATAAYGSYFESHVKILRDFRDAYLLTNAPGRAFVAWYYRTAPPIADYIAGRAYLRMLVRWALTPVVYAIRYPLLLVILLLMPLGIWRIRRRTGADRGPA